MLTDRSLIRDKKSARNNNSNLPDSLMQSPERDEIIVFAPLQKSPYLNPIGQT